MSAATSLRAPTVAAATTVSLALYCRHQQGEAAALRSYHVAVVVSSGDPQGNRTETIYQIDNRGSPWHVNHRRRPGVYLPASGQFVGCFVVGHVADFSVADLGDWIVDTFPPSQRQGDWLHNKKWNCVSWAFNVLRTMSESEMLVPNILVSQLERLYTIMFVAANQFEDQVVPMNHTGLRMLVLDPRNLGSS